MISTDFGQVYHRYTSSSIIHPSYTRLLTNDTQALICPRHSLTIQVQMRTTTTTRISMSSMVRLPFSFPLPLYSPPQHRRPRPIFPRPYQTAPLHNNNINQHQPPPPLRLWPPRPPSLRRAPLLRHAPLHIPSCRLHLRRLRIHAGAAEGDGEPYARDGRGCG